MRGQHRYTRRGERKESAPQPRREPRFGKGEEADREAQRRATSYGRARGKA